MDKNLIPGGSKIASSFETSAPFNIETAKINKAYLIKFLIVIALLTSQFGKNCSYIIMTRSLNYADQS
jgi:hypothetical protein